MQDKNEWIHDVGTTKKGWKGFEDAEERLVTITEKDLKDRYD